MKSKFLSVVLILFLLFTSLVTSTALAALPQNNSDEELARSINYREKMGFNKDTNYVKNVTSDQAAKEYIKNHGIALTPAEAKEVERRIKIQEEVPNIKKILERHLDSEDFGGIYIDHKEGY
ncbi:hypothetical protein GCM10008018_61760 [Paenibacillus marchantiophytorum]|uniref:Uncharacterized protein n=1 Tax=Paenibacillus marchantiophytorum TaxID=1619310 RepID=A0ABQ1FEZ4_9BACL|nr:hypothetical protein [Paenibacillus marchantiophytorum]GGA07625.1 hypothetical protein GCM10008018_61760 [Paenibacillus marchantiophytorum]